MKETTDYGPDTLERIMNRRDRETERKTEERRKNGKYCQTISYRH